MTPRPVTPPPDMRKVREEVERRMRPVVEEALRGWPAIGAATAPDRAPEYEQLVEDVIDLPRLNKPDLLAEFLQVMASEQYKVESGMEVNLAIANRLIAARRQIEIEVFEALPTPRSQPETRGPIGRIWWAVSRFIVASGAVLLALGGVAVLFANESGLTGLERFAMALALILTGGTLIYLFFFAAKAQRAIEDRAWKKAMRRTVEQMYERDPRDPTP